MLSRDGSQVQATIDQFIEIRGVAYVFVEDPEGEIFGHTFIPTVPPAIRSTLLGGKGRDLHETIVATDLQLADGTDITDIAAPVLAGVAGTVHVGMDREVIQAEIVRAVVRIQSVLLLVLLTSVGLSYVWINRVVDPARVLTHHVQTVSGLDLSTLKPDPTLERMASRSHDEFGHLARAFMDMEAQLVTALRTRDELVGVRKELDIAGSIQSALLPQALTANAIAGRFDIHAVMIPAKEVGGDFYDYFLIDQERIGFVVGDVSGKGVAAALYMAVSRTLLRATALQGFAPHECLRIVNDRLCADTDSGLFVTITYAILDTTTGELRYATGGHPPPIVVADSGLAYEMKKAPGTVLGMMEDLDYEEERVTLAAGDHLVLYSDGVSEAMSPTNELFGEERLVDFLGTLRAATAEGANHAVVDRVRRFADTAPQADDITVLTLIYRGPNVGA
jgi:sigma-B regulation protein RsbU (phosphoserine phosphatase)